MESCIRLHRDAARSFEGTQKQFPSFAVIINKPLVISVRGPRGTSRKRRRLLSGYVGQDTVLAADSSRPSGLFVLPGALEDEPGRYVERFLISAL